METFVYVMSCFGRTKIGISANPTKRKRQIQNASGAHVALRTTRAFRSKEAAALVELALHRRYGQSRGLGEWFDTGAHQVCLALHAMDEPIIPEEEPIEL